MVSNKFVMTPVQRQQYDRWKKTGAMLRVSGRDGHAHAPTNDAYFPQTISYIEQRDHRRREAMRRGRR